MTARDHAPTAKRQRKDASFFQGVLDRPIPVIVSALLFAGAALYCNVFFAKPEPIRTIVHVERLDLDQDADHPTSLIRTLPFSIDDERAAILSDRLIETAVEKAIMPPASTGSSDETVEQSLDRAALSVAIRTDLRIEDAIVSNELEISLGPNTFKAREQAVDVVDTIAAAYVELLKREREQQKQQASRWAEKRLNDRYATLEMLRSKGTGATMDTVPMTASRSTDGPKLHGFLLAATKSAQSETLSALRDVLRTSGTGRRDSSIKLLERDYASLDREFERLQNVSPLPSNGQGTRPSNLQDAEEQLVRFKDSLDELISSGRLKEPAATIVQSASAETVSRTPLPWSVAIPLAAALGILLALLIVAAITKWAQGRNGNRDREGLERSDSVLTDPYWPLKPHQRQEVASSQRQG